MNEIRGVIFDMDGVLIDARDWHYQAFNQALKLFGLSISPEEHANEYDGLPTREKLWRLTSRYGLPPSLHSFINEMKQRYTMQIIHQQCWPVFEHQYALAELSRTGYQLAVASNSIRSSIETMLGRANLLRYLDFYLSNEDVQFGKPNPEIYSRAFAKMQLSPEQCVVIEDNDHGIAAAKAAGANVLCVKDPSEVTLGTITHFIAQCNKELV